MCSGHMWYDPTIPRSAEPNPAEIFLLCVHTNSEARQIWQDPPSQLPNDSRHNRRHNHSSALPAHFAQTQGGRSHNNSGMWPNQSSAVAGPPQQQYHAYLQGGWQEQAYSSHSVPHGATSRHSGDLQNIAAPHYQSQGGHYPGQPWEHQSRDFSQAQAQHYPQPPPRQQHPHQLLEAGYVNQEAARQLLRAGHGGGDAQQPGLPTGMLNLISSSRPSGAVPSSDPALIMQALEGGHGGRGQQHYPPQHRPGVDAQQGWPMGLPTPDQPPPRDSRFQGYDRERFQQQQGIESMPHAPFVPSPPVRQEFNDGDSPFYFDLSMNTLIP